MSVYRVGSCRYTETRESGYRVGACRYADPDPVGIPTPSESVARHSKAGIPTLPRGSGDCPNGLASVQVSTRQNARLHSALCKVALAEVQVCTTANANLRRCESSLALRQLQTCTSHSPWGRHKRRFCVNCREQPKTTYRHAAGRRMTFPCVPTGISSGNWHLAGRSRGMFL